MSDDNSLAEFFKQYGEPGNPEYHNNMGVAHRMQGELEQAIREYQEAIRLNPYDVRYYANLASVLAEQGDDEAALRYYESALRLDSQDYVTFFNLGNLLRRMERVEEAMIQYRRAIQLEPERAEAVYALAGCYWDQKRWPEATSHYRQGLAADPEAAVAGLAHMRLGVLYTDGRSWGEAENHLLEALNRQEEHFIVHYCLTIVYLNMPAGEGPAWVLPAKAVLHARQALEMQPGDADALQLAQLALEAFERTKTAQPP
ncbi:MAG: tetratricopeptide repeat protein [Chloroflexi bacterium]|nr:tetratricopeptide repeat protein [Chloroflexota bacterium]MCI0575175.1 tetratricopeptide repeat protein [Chloroflexota bacterium]MCI0647143.1 tetratricopeptide repeat protein [Chloroflexota bacterium]MCI0729981.1 tetratricopeptide repeat protein [Chloroflexota bacterium]